MKYFIMLCLGFLTLGEPAIAMVEPSTIQAQIGVRLRRSAPNVFLMADGFQIYRFRPPAGSTQFRFYGQESWNSLDSVPDRTGILRVSVVNGERRLVSRQGSWQSYVSPTGFFKIGTYIYYRGTVKPPVFEFNVPSGRVIRADFS